MPFNSNWPARSRDCLILCLVSLVCSGCQHATPVPPSTGQASFRVVDPPDARPVAKGKATQLVPPHLGDTRQSFAEAFPRGDLPSPTYPPEALAADAGWVLIGVRITIGIDGRVVAVEPSPMGISNAGKYSEQFMAAIATAVQSWRFFPARLRTETVLQSEGGTLYWGYTASESTESVTDLSFDFSEKAAVSWKK